MSSVQAHCPRRIRWPRRAVARVISRRRCPRDSGLNLTRRHRGPPSLELLRNDRNCPVWSSRDFRLPNRSRCSIGKDLVVLVRSMQYAARTIPPTGRPQRRTAKVYWGAMPSCTTMVSITTLFASLACLSEHWTNNASKENPRF